MESRQVGGEENTCLQDKNEIWASKSGHVVPVSLLLHMRKERTKKE